MGQSYQGENVVFIIGSPRSGTTWLQKMLACHPDIETGQESNFFIAYARHLIRNWEDELADKSGRGGTGLPCYMHEQDFYDTIAELFKKIVVQRVLQDDFSNKLFVEKTPSHALVVNQIHRTLPKARFILLVRDPRDVVASMLAASKGWGKDWAPSNVLRAGHMWRVYVRSARESFKSLPPRLWLMLRYEDLYAKTKSLLCAVFTFLNLEIGEEMTARFLERTSIETEIKNGNPLRVYGEVGAKLGGLVKEPVGFVRKGIVGSWREDLGIIRGMMVKLMTSDEMKRFGYW